MTWIREGGVFVMMGLKRIPAKFGKQSDGKGNLENFRDLESGSPDLDLEGLPD